MKNILQNRPLLRRNRCFWEKFVLLLPALFLFAAFSGCDLLLDKPEIELEKAIDEKAAYAGAPYVAILIDEGGLGTASPRGSLDTAVKLGYSFLVNYLPKSEYPFRGWQAKLEGSGEFLGVWNRETGEESGADKVRFVPLNEAGTEAEIFVFIKPEERIVIGPLGADAAELSVRVDEGGTGTANPRGSVSGVRLGFPFQVSFLPNANYDFNGWQVRREGSGNLLGSWAAGTEAQEGADIQFNPKNLAGTEMEITIRQISGEGTIVVEPLNAQNPFLTVELSAGGLGTISPTGTTTTTIKQGFPFSVSYAANSAYPFSGWQAKFEGETQLLASWTADGASGGDKVVFAPANITGTEVKVTILIDPAEEKIIIAPLGADYPELNVEVDEAGMGTASPRGTLAGIKQGIPFTLNYAARAEYPFTGWQAVYKGTAEIIASWTPEGATGSGIVSWKAVNIAGTETQVTIHVNPGSDRTIVIGPYGANLPYVNVEVNEGGMGTASPRGTLAGIKQGIPFTLSYSSFTEYGFLGWEAVLDSARDTPLGTDKVEFSPADTPETSVTIKIPTGSDQVIIRPKGGLAPAPVSVVPSSYEGTATGDRVIRIQFSKPIDPASFLFDNGYPFEGNWKDIYYYDGGQWDPLGGYNDRAFKNISLKATVPPYGEINFARYYYPPVLSEDGTVLTLNLQYEPDITIRDKYKLVTLTLNRDIKDTGGVPMGRNYVFGIGQKGTAAAHKTGPTGGGSASSRIYYNNSFGRASPGDDPAWPTALRYGSYDDEVAYIFAKAGTPPASPYNPSQGYYTNDGALAPGYTVFDGSMTNSVGPFAYDTDDNWIYIVFQTEFLNSPLAGAVVYEYRASTSSDTDNLFYYSGELASPVYDPAIVKPLTAAYLARTSGDRPLPVHVLKYRLMKRAAADINNKTGYDNGVVRLGIIPIDVMDKPKAVGPGYNNDDFPWGTGNDKTELLASRLFQFSEDYDSDETDDDGSSPGTAVKDDGDFSVWELSTNPGKKAAKYKFLARLEANDISIVIRYQE